MSIVEPTIIRKKPGERLALDFVFTNLLPSADETIGSPTVAADGGLVLGSAVVAGQVVQQLVSGGVAGTRYRVACTVTSSPAGWIRQLVGYIQVEEG